MGLDTLSSAPTSRSQPPDEPRRGGGAAPPRRPSGSDGEGLRGFQFPLVRPRGSETGPGLQHRPPPLQRNHSAAPFVPVPSDSPTKPQHLPPPLRPTMMRQASVAVMEGRQQSQVQALAMAQVQAQAQAQEGSLSSTKNLAMPGSLGRPSGSGGMLMMRSKSQGRVDNEGGGLGAGVGLRDLLKVNQSFRFLTRASSTRAVARH
jgi:protein-serine/threonine kinase